MLQFVLKIPNVEHPSLFLSLFLGFSTYCKNSITDSNEEKRFPPTAASPGELSFGAKPVTADR
jgi:hypothetical protein